MHKRITIQNLIGLGLKKKVISEKMECHRNTVRNIEKENPVKEKVEQPEKKHSLDIHREYIQSGIDEGLTLVRIYEKLKEERGYEKGYDLILKYVKSRKLKPQKVYTVLHSAPGEEGQVDFGYVGKTPDSSGKMRKTYVFVMLLSHSRKGFHKIVYNQTVETFIDCHIEAFEYFSGVPERIKIDNLKSAILEANFYEPEYQKEYLQFSKYYGFISHACKVRYPEEKGKVESGIKYVKNNFFQGRTFKNETDVKYQLFLWQENVCNARIHGTTKKVPEIIFSETEKEKLRPLPDTRWEIFRYEHRKVGTNCHIVAEWNYYSVPYTYIGESVEVQIGKNLVKIFFKNQLIASHVKLKNRGEYQTNTVHYPLYKATSQTEYQFKMGTRMKEIGEYAYTYFQTLKEKFPHDWGRKIRGILHLEKQYGKEAVNRSCERAIFFEVYSYKVIANICHKRLYNQSQEIMHITESKQKETSLLRPLSYYAHIYIFLIFFLWNLYLTLSIH